jgi:hypothetical protein
MSITKKYLWRVFSPSLGEYGTTISTTKPTTFPTDGSPVDPRSTVILKNVFQEISSNGPINLNTNDSQGISLTTDSSICLRSLTNVYIKTQAIEKIIQPVDLHLLITQLMSGILVSTPNDNAIIWTLPIISDMINAISTINENDSFDFSVINLGKKTISLTSTATEHNIRLGIMDIRGGKSATFRIRLQNVSKPAPSYVIYRLS